MNELAFAFLDYSYIAIAIVKGKMVSVSIHARVNSSSVPSTPEHGDNPMAEKNLDENHVNSEKDVQFALLSTPRCGFGLTTANKKIYALGKFFENLLSF